MNHLVAVQEHQATDDVQRHQMTLTASTQQTQHWRSSSSRGAWQREGATKAGGEGGGQQGVS